MTMYGFPPVGWDEGLDLDQKELAPFLWPESRTCSLGPGTRFQVRQGGGSPFWARLAVARALCCLCAQARAGTIVGRGRRVIVGGPLYIRVPASGRQTSPTVTARAGGQAVPWPPCPQGQLQPQPEPPAPSAPWSDTVCGVPANGPSRGLGSSTEARTRVRSRGTPRRISRLLGGPPGATTATDDGAAPQGGCTGSVDGATAPPGDAGDAPAGAGGIAEVGRPTSLPLPTLTPPGHGTGGSGWLGQHRDPVHLDSPQAPSLPPSLPGSPRWPHNRDFLFPKSAEG